MAKNTLYLYWDNQDPANEGWAWRVDGQGSGPVDRDLGREATLSDVLDAARANLPKGAAAARWQRLPNLGWSASIEDGER